MSDTRCLYYTYDGTPYYDLCLLFADCDAVSDAVEGCEGCTTSSLY